MPNAVSSSWRSPFLLPFLVILFGSGTSPGLLAQDAELSPEDQQLMVQMLANRHAKRVCSGVFLSGRTAAAILEEDHDTPRETVEVHVNRVAGTVEVQAMGATGLAAYRPGLGCTLTYDLSAAQLADQLSGDYLPEALDPDMAWPLGARVDVSTPSGVDRAALDSALEDAFSEPDPDVRRGTRGVLVVYEGKVVAERYAPGFGPDRPLIIWSMSKSVTSAVVGLLVRDGKLDVMAPAPVPEWATEGDPRREITTDQLLRMSSGLEFEEVYEQGLIDVVVMLFGKPDMAHFAAAQPLETDPDGKWSYSSGTSNIVSRIARQALGGELDAYVSYVREELLDRIGMHQTVLEPDEAGTLVGSSFGYSTPRDLARFGQLYLQGGKWSAEQVLPKSWVDYSVTPTPLSPMQVYGAHFWLNAGDPEDSSKRQWPSVPVDAYGLSGFEGQSVTVVPSRKAVIVRLGRSVGEGAFSLDGFLGNVLSALPGS